MTKQATKSDSGAALALSIAEDDMDALEAYFADKGEADIEGTPLEETPNEELRLLVTVRNLRTQVRRLARAAGAK